MTPDKAFILAAGLGQRLRPYTNDLPKPMVKVWGKPMIDHALEKLKAVGVKECVINTHYKADILKEHLKSCASPVIIISHEEELLNTGGGITNAISHFDAPFFVLSGDSVWEDAKHENTLNTLSKAWNPETMDILILLQPVNSMALTQGVGDYNIDEQGRAIRALDKTGKYMFTSIRINTPAIFDAAPAGAFSYLDLLDKAQEQGRLYGLVHNGMWHHISTPDDLDAVNAAGEIR